MTNNLMNGKIIEPDNYIEKDKLKEITIKTVI